MKGSLLLPILFSLQYVVVYSVIPSLVVKKLDRTLIARKRQDTMDMCRIFTEENQRTHHSHAPKIIKSYAPVTKRRYKRDVPEDIHGNEKSKRYKRYTGDEPDHRNMNKQQNESGQLSRKQIHRFQQSTMMHAVNPALNPSDTRRVEKIVDKLYDDLEDKGERVTYRQVQTTDLLKVPRNKTVPSRRFDFAPASLTQGQKELKTPPIPEDVPFPSKAKWKQGIVPYFIDSKTYDAHLSEVIMKAFDYVEKATCIRLQRLREKPTDNLSLNSINWLYISNPTGIRQCVHSNEKRRKNGVQMAMFGYDCMSLGDIVHEVMHILGYSHEHLRSDRDQYISVLWDNIKPGYKKYFDLNIEGSEYDLESLPYDYASILHYPPRAFSKNGKATMLTKPGITIGQREGLSEIDVEKVALIYSNECVSRNKEYLLQTCPSVVKSVEMHSSNVTDQEIKGYFRDRLWPYGIINYRFRDKMEFSIEERENIKAVFQHIEQETCLQFRNVAVEDDDEDDSNENDEEQTKAKTTARTTTTFSLPVKSDTLPSFDGYDEQQIGDQKISTPESTPKPGIKIESMEDPVKVTSIDPQDTQATPESTPTPGIKIESMEDPEKVTRIDPQDTQATEPVSMESGQSQTNQPSDPYSQDQNTDSIEQSTESGQDQTNRTPDPYSQGQTTDSIEQSTESGQDQTNQPSDPYSQDQNTVSIEQSTESGQSQTNRTPDPYSQDQTTDSIEHILGPGIKATAVITQQKELRRLGNKDEDLRNNEISGEKNKISSGYNNFNDIKNMNITMKKALLKKAKQKIKNKRYRRDTQGPQTRRHANAILVLRRTPDPVCQCPNPGAPKGDKMLDLSAGCFNSVNDLLHFFVHLLGLEHQHNMHDRDNYLHIVWENLTPDIAQELKNKLPPAASAGLAYDYHSVMHFPWMQIKNGKSNIMYPIWNDGWAMGHWQGLSSMDVQKLSNLYMDQCMERHKQKSHRQ